MKRACAVLAFGLIFGPVHSALACDLKLSEFQALVGKVEAEVETFEAALSEEDGHVDKQFVQTNSISFGTACPDRLTSAIEQTKGRTQDLVAQLTALQASDDMFFGCVIALRERGNALMRTAQANNDSTRVLRLKQALDDLTDYDQKATSISIRLTYALSKAERLQRQSEINAGICAPDEGGLDALDF